MKFLARKEFLPGWDHCFSLKDLTNICDRKKHWKFFTSDASSAEAWKTWRNNLGNTQTCSAPVVASVTECKQTFEARNIAKFRKNPLE